MQKKSRVLNLFSSLLLFVLAPVVVFLGFRHLDSRYYYLSAAGVIILSLLPFFIMFEKRKIKTAELAAVAVMIALCVASRLAFAFVPQVKPLCALVIITASSFGPNVGFVTGALSVFLSNFAFGQGMFTPFQMLGMGLCGFCCGLLFHEKKLAKNRLAVSAAGFAVTLCVYGFIVDSCSVLMTVTDFTAKNVFAVLLSGLPFNLIHAATTALVLFFAGKPMSDKLFRLHEKYGIFSLEEN